MICIQTIRELVVTPLRTDTCDEIRVPIGETFYVCEQDREVLNNEGAEIFIGGERAYLYLGEDIEIVEDLHLHDVHRVVLPF